MSFRSKSFSSPSKTAEPFFSSGCLALSFFFEIYIVGAYGLALVRFREPFALDDCVICLLEAPSDSSL